MADSQAYAPTQTWSRLAVDFGCGALGGLAVLAVAIGVGYLLSNIQQRIDDERGRA